MAHRLPASTRVRGRLRFRMIIARRSSAGNARLVVYLAPNGADTARIGIMTPRRLGSAVRRNRLRRLVREAFRLSRGDLPAGFDMVVVVRTPEDAALECYRRDLMGLSRRAASREREK